ncbi:hypothetical protein ACFW4K_05270 [Nocardiopsis alba]|uniref:hypothetical protein n=1 Tax=Nocardiopsis alba TaxID=53437 RepID=UPI003672CD9A
MSSSAGVNPVEAMNEAEQAEELAIRTTAAAPTLEDIADELKGAVSSYVTSGVSGFEIKVFDNISRLAQNSVNLAQDVQGADLQIAATDHDASDEFRDGLDLLDIPVNF